jgi:hypothetical protein
MQLPLIKTTSAVQGRSVRQRIFDALEAKVLAMEDNSEKIWLAVYYGDPDSIGNEKAPFIAIDCGTEEKLQNYGGCTLYQVPVFLHMRWRPTRGLDSQDRYLYYLALLQKAVLADHNLGGLTQNIEEDDNTHTMMGIEDAYPGGTLSITIQYKTRLHDPYKSPHDPHT